MMIGVLSDSHDNIWVLRRGVEKLIRRCVKVFIHLGDIVAPFTLKALKDAGVRRLVAIYGNNCGERLGLLSTAKKLGFEIHVPPYRVEIGGAKILLVHGWGSAENTVNLVEGFALSGRYDVVMYGHTHKPDVRTVARSLLLNPGEVCGCLTNRNTAAILYTEEMRAEIVEI